MSDLYSLLANDDEHRPSGSPPLDSDKSEPARKKPRVNQACETCRERKTRCGGERPVCHACEKRGVGISCTYERGAIKRKTTSLGAPSELRNSSHTPREQLYAATTSFAPINRTEPQEPARRTIEPARAPLLSAPGMQIEDHKHRETNGTHAFRPAVHVEDELTSPRAPRASGQERNSGSPLRNDFRPPEKIFVGSQNVLPRRRDADEFVRCYWEYTHPLFPILQKASFMKQYEQLWSADSDVKQTEFEETIFMSALNIVFAIGCRYSDFVDDKPSLSDEFYQRSRKIFCYDVLDTATLSTIQLLLLTAIHLQSTEHAIRCWNVIGLASRAAQTIGLHLEYAGRESKDAQLYSGVRLRIWHSCVLLDRLTSMTIGRPAGMPKIDTPLPTTLDDGAGGNDLDRLRVQELPSVECFTYSCKLSDILADILDNFYDVQYGKVVLHDGRLTEERYFLDSLLKFRERIDDLVQYDVQGVARSLSQMERCTRWQRQVLHSRVLCITLLSLRPFVMVVLYTDALKRFPPLEAGMMRTIFVQCLKSAQELIYDMHGRLYGPYPLSTWQIAVFTCASLTIHICFLSSEFAPTDDASLEKSWDQGIDILERLQDRLLPSAAEGIRKLQSLKRQVLDFARGRETADMSPGDKVDVSELNHWFDSITGGWYSQYFVDASWLEPTSPSQTYKLL